MEWFFRATDPVKFAKMLPDQDTLARFGIEVRAFLEATRPVIQAEAKQENQSQIKGSAS
jgi:hypothetical protein